MTIRAEKKDRNDDSGEAKLGSSLFSHCWRDPRYIFLRSQQEPTERARLEPSSQCLTQISYLLDQRTQVGIKL